MMHFSRQSSSSDRVANTAAYTLASTSRAELRRARELAEQAERTEDPAEKKRLEAEARELVERARLLIREAKSLSR